MGTPGPEPLQNVGVILSVVRLIIGVVWRTVFPEAKQMLLGFAFEAAADEGFDLGIRNVAKGTVAQGAPNVAIVPFAVKP